MIADEAAVDPGAQVGHGVRLGARVHVRELATIGDHCLIGDGVYVDRAVEIGPRCSIMHQVSVYQGVHIGADVVVGPQAVFTNDRAPRASGVDWRLGETRVGNGVVIGANATIVCGVAIGEGALIDPGSVVTRDVPARARVGGCPARVLERDCAGGDER